MQPVLPQFLLSPLNALEETGLSRAGVHNVLQAKRLLYFDDMSYSGQQLIDIIRRVFWIGYQSSVPDTIEDFHIFIVYTFHRVR